MFSVKWVSYLLAFVAIVLSLFVKAAIDTNNPIELSFEIILAMKKADDNFPQKDEFETTSEYTARVKAYTKNILDPLTRPTYKISEAKLEQAYDADHSKWTFSLFTPALEAEKVLIIFLSHESGQVTVNKGNKAHFTFIDIKLANSFPLKHSLLMERDLAKAINKSIRAKYTFKLATPPNKTMTNKSHVSFIQTDKYNTIYIDLIELQLYAMDTVLATYSHDSVIIHKIDSQLATQMQERLSKKKQHISYEIKKYTELITATIYSNLITDKHTMEGKTCTLTISLAPSGGVNNVLAIDGDLEVCKATKKSIFKAGTLPVSQEPDIFKKIATFHLTIAPEF